jgi:predicted permease
MLPAGVRRVLRLFRGHGDVADDLDTEIAFHLESKAEALIASGMRPADARVEALRQFGDVARARRELAAIDHRHSRRTLRADALEALWDDVRFAARCLARAPAFTAVVVFTLALGLGATAAMFGVLDRLLLRAPIGVSDPDRVVRLYVRGETSDFGPPGPRTQCLYEELGDFGGASSVVAVAFMAGGQSVPLADDVGSRDVRASMVSGSCFKVLGVRPALGRALSPADDSAGSAPAAVVSHALWESRYGGSRSVIGRVVHVMGRAYTVVGVAPRGFSGLAPRTVDLWLPINVAAPDFFGPAFRNPHIRNYAFEAVARLKAGVTREQVAAELTLLFRRRQEPQPAGLLGFLEPKADVGLGSIIPGRSRIELGNVGVSLSLSLLAAAVALVVCLIAMANVANLLLLRALGRRRETGVRLALGVSRWRLVRAVLVESLLLAAVAAAAAAWVSSAGGELLRKLLVRDDWAVPLFGLRVFGFVALSAFVMGLVTGLVPAFLGGRSDVLASLRAGVRLSAWRRSRVRGALMVGQVALTVLLLAGFGLFARSLERAGRVDFGIDVPHLLVASTRRPNPKAAPPDVDELLARVRALPGVRAAAAEQSALPMYGYGVASLRAEGVASLANNTSKGGPFYSQIGPGYLAAAGIRLLRGRTFSAGEYVSPAPVALVSEEMARRLWPGGDAVGKCLYIQVGMQEPPCSSIVGVVGNVRQFVSEPPLMQYYRPLGSDARLTEPDIVVRTAGDPSRLVAPVAALLKSLEPDLPDGTVHTVPALLGDQFRTWRLGTTLFAMFGALALLVAMVGLYSVVAFDGAQRTHEFGIRVALGAGGWDLAGLLLGQGLRYGAAGLVLGLGLVAVTGHVIVKQLFRTSPRDPVALVAVGLLLLAAMLAACLVPARSAARADPRTSLQAE